MPVTSLRKTCARPPESPVDQDQDQEHASLRWRIAGAVWVSRLWFDVGLPGPLCGPFATRGAPTLTAFVDNTRSTVGAALCRERAAQQPQQSQSRRKSCSHTHPPCASAARRALDLPATSEGRTQALRREVPAMDGRQALRARMARSARSSREHCRSEGAPQRRGRMWERRLLVPFGHDQKGLAVRAGRGQNVQQIKWISPQPISCTSRYR